MNVSRHAGGADVLTSADDLYVALGVRLRERPGAHWVVEMHPQTRAEFDVRLFRERIRTEHVRLNENSHLPLGEYHLMQRGFGVTTP